MDYNLKGFEKYSDEDDDIVCASHNGYGWVYDPRYVYSEPVYYTDTIGGVRYQRVIPPVRIRSADGTFMEYLLGVLIVITGILWLQYVSK